MNEIVKHEPNTIYIKPSTGFAALNLRDLWMYRELVYFMFLYHISHTFMNAFDEHIPDQVAAGDTAHSAN